MESRLIANDINGALDNFIAPSVAEHRQVFSDLRKGLPAIAAGMEDIEKVYIEDRVAQYRIKKSPHSLTSNNNFLFIL